MIDSLTDQQKSVLLAKALGWRILGDIVCVPVEGQVELIPQNTGHHVPNEFTIRDLYDPANMALAKRVAEWAYRIDLSGFIIHLEKYAFAILVEEHGFAIMLDRILKMAIEAGLIEVKDA